MKYIKLIFILCSLLLLQGCPIDPPIYSLKVENNSDYDIVTFAPFPIDDLKPTAYPIYPADVLYPDTSISFGGSLSSTSAAHSITSPFHWVFKHFKNREAIFVKIDTLCVFLISADTLRKYPHVEDLNRIYNILQRYDVSLENMRQLNWTIVYPPDERMRDVKMYPPYSITANADTNK